MPFAATARAFREASPVTRGVILMLTAMFFFVGMDAMAKLLIQEHNLVQVTWARYAGQTAIVFLIIAPRLATTLRTRHPKIQFARSACQFGASMCFFASLGQIGLAEATAIADINPVLITLGAALFLGERLGPRRLLGVGAAFVGAMIIIRPGTGAFQPAALLALAAAVFYAAFALMTRRVGRDESAWTSLAYTALFGTVVTSVAVVFYWQPVRPALIPAFVAIGLVGALGQLLLIRAFTLTEASLIAPFGYAGLVFATFWGVVVFDEWPDLWTVVGALVIAGAGLYVWHRETRALRAEAQSRPPE